MGDAPCPHSLGCYRGRERKQMYPTYVVSYIISEEFFTDLHFAVTFSFLTSANFKILFSPP